MVTGTCSLYHSLYKAIHSGRHTECVESYDMMQKSIPVLLFLNSAQVQVPANMS